MASYTKEKLEYLKETKGLIRSAIEAKGQTVHDLDTFRSYADKIGAIETASDPVLQPLTITENGTYTAPAGVDGYNPVTVEVDPTKVTLLKEQQISGFSMDATFGYSVYDFEPTYEITEGEKYFVAWDGATYETTAVSADSYMEGVLIIGNGSAIGLPGNDEPFLIGYRPGTVMYIAFADDSESHTVGIWHKLRTEFKLQDKTITENGEYTADSGFDGLGKVTVDVAGSGGSADLHYVTFMNRDGTKELGKKAVADGDDCADPIVRGIFGTPTEESSDQYNFTFSGSWATVPNGGADANALKSVTEDRVVYANFVATVRYYTITYYDSDGTTVLKTESLAYGAMPSYTASKEDYAFAGWIPELAEVTGNVSYIAQFIESTTFADASWDTIASISASGNADKMFSVGDVKTIKLAFNDGTIADVEVEIIGFNHDTLSDGSGKAGITIGTKPAISLLYFFGMSSSADAKLNSGWPNSVIRTKLNDDVISRLPTDLVPHIKEVNKLSKATVPESIDKIFIPSTTEYGGGTSYGAQYEHYKTVQNRKKYQHYGISVDTSYVDHMARIQGDNGLVQRVSTNGTVYTSSSMAGTVYNFVFCFCV